MNAEEKREKRRDAREAHIIWVPGEGAGHWRIWSGRLSGKTDRKSKSAGDRPSGNPAMSLLN